MRVSSPCLTIEGNQLELYLCLLFALMGYLSTKYYERSWSCMELELCPLKP
jgi:hypothetical protein